MSEHIWKTRDGRLLPVSKMSTDHIRKALSMLKRKGYIAAATLRAYMRPNPCGGDGAQMAFEQEQDRAYSSPVHPFIDIFQEELDRRTELNKCMCPTDPKNCAAKLHHKGEDVS